MAKAVKQKNGKWKIRVYNYTDEHGKVHVKSFTADTKKECEYLASKFALIKKEMVSVGKTVNVVINEYVKSKSSILSPSTLRVYNIYIKRYFNDIENIKLKNLTVFDVQNFINNLSKNLSPKTVRNIYNFLTAALKPYNLSFSIVLPQRIKFQVKIPNNSEMKKILELVKNTKLEIPVMLASQMGLRRSEICALTWNDVDFDNRLLNINKAIVVNEYNEEVIKTTKTTSSTRTLRIPKPLFELLISKKKECGKICEMNLYNISYNFIHLMRKNGLPSFRFHDLRHYNASVMLALGIPDKYAMEIMGHSTNNMLKTVYQHTMENKRIEINDVLDDYFSKT